MIRRRSVWAAAFRYFRSGLSQKNRWLIREYFHGIGFLHRSCPAIEFYHKVNAKHEETMKVLHTVYKYSVFGHSLIFTKKKNLDLTNRGKLL